MDTTNLALKARLNDLEMVFEQSRAVKRRGWNETVGTNDKPMDTKLEFHGEDKQFVFKVSTKTKRFLEVRERARQAGFAPMDTKQTATGKFSAEGVGAYLLSIEKEHAAIKQGRRLMLQHALRDYKELVAVLGGLEQNEKDEHGVK